MKKIIDIIKKNKLLVSIYLLLGIFLSFLNNFNANYFQKLIDKFNTNTLTVETIIIYGTIITMLCILNYLDEYPGRKLEHSIFLDLKLKALRKISHMDYQEYQRVGTGKLIQRIDNGASSGKGILFDFTFCLIRDLIPSIIFSLIFIYKINKTIMATIVVGYLGVFLITNLLLKSLYKINERILTNEENMNHFLVRGFMEMVIFRVNKRFDYEINKATFAKKEIVNAKVKRTLIHEAFFAIFGLMITFIKIAIIAYGWITKSLSIGSIVALITLVDNAYKPIAIFNVLYVQLKLEKIAFKRYTDFLNSKDDKQLGEGKEILNFNGDIAFKDLKFSYENREIFNKLNLDIKASENVAFIGQSGCGKSTLIKLLMGLLKPESGNVVIDNYDLSTLDLNSYYEHIAYIPQESPIFDGTLKENLVFDKPIDDSIIIEVLFKVGLSDLYNKLTKGLNTELGERGVTLSGGERQRLALARLWFVNADIVILDESTSAMDNITEENVMNNVMNILKDKTVIIIAHRLNIVKNFDKIILFKDGNIVGKDSFSNLIEENLYFKELYITNVDV